MRSAWRGFKLIVGLTIAFVGHAVTLGGQFVFNIGERLVRGVTDTED